MPSLRQCLGCRKLTRNRSYCRACSVKNERAKLKSAPWLMLYDLPAWNRTKWAVHRRDGYRCTYVDARGRCRVTKETGPIEAHHVRKVRDLWLDAGRNKRKFVMLGLDQAGIVTLCRRHHQLADGWPTVLGRRRRARLSAARRMGTG
jgi:hypothetical protein